MAIDFKLHEQYKKGCFIPREKGERLMFITHRTSKYTEYEEVKMVLDGGCSWVQLRMKDNMNIFTAREISQLICAHETKCTYCINDNIQIALRCGATAVHLGKEDITVAEAWKKADELLYPDENFYIGATANTFEDISRAIKQGASYIGLGPFRHTETKKKLSPVLGLEGYQKIIQQCKDAGYNIPIFAIGGICLEDVGALMQTGITGIAVSGAIINADDPVEETRRFINEINKY